MLGLDLGTLVTYNPLSVSAETSTRAALETMQLYNIRHMPVVDESKDLLGIFSDADVARVIGCQGQATHEILNQPVRALMTGLVIAVPSDGEPRAALGLLLQHGFHALPVTLDGHLTGMLTSSDFLREFADGTLLDWDAPVTDHFEPCTLRVDADSPVDAAIAALQEHHAQQLLIFHADRVLGVVTERQLARVFREALFQAADQHEELAWDAASLGDLLPKVNVCLPPEQTLRGAARMMMEQGLEALPVLDDQGTLLGVLADTDILAAIFAQMPE